MPLKTVQNIKLSYMSISNHFIQLIEELADIVLLLKCLLQYTRFIRGALFMPYTHWFTFYYF